MSIPNSEQANHAILREAVSTPIIQHRSTERPTAAARRRTRAQRRARHRLGRKGRCVKNDGDDDDEEGEKEGDGRSGGVNEEGNADVVEGGGDDGDEDGNDDGGADDLADFINYISTEIFTCFPSDLRTLSYDTYTSTAVLRDTYSVPIPSVTLASLLARVPHSVPDSLSSYQFLRSADQLPLFFGSIVENYIAMATAPPPEWSKTRTTECELCGRDWIPLTYHHLIPRSTHDKVLKRGWHPEWRLNVVAWLCRACHNFVHRMAGNEELAREWWSVDLIRGREDVVAWVNWVSRVRWKKK